ncbi:MAG: TnpV protein, partial [Ruminococcaceae bacterium]|nr:TnpV protein [Oscillospiraceae bacterium]
MYIPNKRRIFYANEMYNLLIEQMKESEGVTEQLKEQDQLEWIQKMNNIQHRAI